MMVQRSTLVAFTVAVLAVLCAPAASASADTAKCQVLEIKATKDAKGGVDPALEPIERKLAKPPFDSWKSFKVLAKHLHQVERMKPLEVDLVPGGKLTLLYRDLMSNPGHKPRLRLSLTLDGKSGKRIADLTVQLDSGDYNLIGGGQLEGGASYILATTCKVN